MAKRYEELMQVVSALKEDFEKFYDKGQKAAGTRIRKAMLDLRNWASEVRKEVQEIKNQAQSPEITQKKTAAKPPAPKPKKKK
ncbi:MAG: hypothetical protein ACUVRD_01715 [Bacteroidia bacterium]